VGDGLDPVTKTETPGEAAAEGRDAPADTPGETAGASGETPPEGGDGPTETPGETPVEGAAEGADAPADTPGETPDAGGETPPEGGDGPTEMPGETPPEGPAEGADAPTEANRAGTGRVPVRYVGWTATVIMTVLFGALSVFLIYAAVATWPVTTAAGAVASQTTTTLLDREFLFWKVSLDIARSYFIVVVLGGAIGSMLYVMRSFTRYVGTRKLVWSWVPKYLLMPVQGAVLASITYIVLRAGLITGPVGTEGNPFGFASIAVLVGLFSEQAISKLKDAMETILTPTPQGADAAADGTTGNKEGGG
jgi:hypothetical protein